MLAVLQLIRMELTRVLREGNTVLYLAFPVVAYPMTIWAMTQAAIYLGDYAETHALPVVVEADIDPEALEGEPLVFTTGTLDDLELGRIEALVRNEGDAVHVHHRKGAVSSRRAARILEDRIVAIGDARLAEAAVDAGADGDALEPYEVEVEPLDEASEVFAWILGLLASSLVPATIVISAFSPATELFVSEREQESLETTMTAAASRLNIVLARIVAAALLGAAGALANLAALTLTLTHTALILSEEEAVLGLGNPLNLIPIVIAVFTCSLVVTAVLVVILSVARTFQEAQILMSPAALPLIAPSLVAVVAGLGGWQDQLLFVPIAHTSVLLESAFSGELGLVEFAVVVGTDLLLFGGVLAIWRYTVGLPALLTGLNRPSWMESLLGASK